MEDLEKIAAVAAKAAVHETFLLLGVDITTPAAIVKMQHNFAFLDEVRENYGKVKLGAITTLVGLLVTGIVGVVWAHVR